MYDECVQTDANTSANCIAVNTNKQCMMCSPGYQLDNDNICNQLKASFCTNEHWIMRNLDKYTASELYVNQFAGGCKESCMSDSSTTRIALPLITGQDTKICAYSDNFINALVDTTNTYTTGYKKLTFCKHIQLNGGNYECLECNSNYVVQ